jgi:cell volume regulation protein A
VFLSWAGLRGAVPIVLATIPIARGLPDATRIFDVVFLLVVLFLLVQAPLLPWLARRTGVASAATRSLEVESAPLEAIGASLLQLDIPEGSRLSGVHVVDLRLPAQAVPSLVHREGTFFAPDEHTSLRAGDSLVLAVSESVREQTEARLRAIDRGGRLAVWNYPVVTTQSASTGAPLRSSRELAMLAATTTRPPSSQAWTRMVSPGKTTPAKRALKPVTRAASPPSSSSVTVRSTMP